MASTLPPRISWTEKNGERFIVIHGQIERWLEGLLIGWTALWTMIGGTIAFQLLGNYSDREKLWFGIFLLFWAYFEYKALYATAWRLWGRELVKVTEDTISIKRDIRGYGKAIRYIKANVKDLKRSDYKRFSYTGSYLQSFWVVSGGRVQFTYLGKSKAVGVQLEDEDADQLMKLLRKPIRTKA